MNDNPILAIACGPIVTTWDITKIGGGNNNNDNHYDNDNGTIIDATSTSSSSVDLLHSKGIGQFKPHGDGENGDIVKDLAWNHNGQGKGHHVCLFYSYIFSYVFSFFSFFKFHF